MRVPFLASALALACLLGGRTAGALAQISPADAGSGVLRGVQDTNNSGQVGTVNLFQRGAMTLVVLEMNGAPRTVSEPAQLRRSRSCSATAPQPAFPLNAVRSGRSSTLVPAPLSQLLSGNYVVSVYSASKRKPSVACGELTPGS